MHDGKLIAGVHELLSCICFNDKEIHCLVSSENDIQIIKNLINDNLSEYLITIKRETEHFMFIDNSYIIFLLGTNADDHNIGDDYTLIDFTLQPE